MSSLDTRPISKNRRDPIVGKRTCEAVLNLALGLQSLNLDIVADEA
jgi:hypothetical protein